MSAASQSYNRRRGAPGRPDLLFAGGQPAEDYSKLRHMSTRQYLAAGTRSCWACFRRLLPAGGWGPALAIAACGLIATVLIWMPATRARLPSLLSLSAPAATNVVLLALVGVAAAALLPRPVAPGRTRALLPLRARPVLFAVWLSLNAWWFIAGIRNRDFVNKPRWLHPTLVPSRALRFSEPTRANLRIAYNVGMAAAWPLLGNLGPLLLPVDRGLLLLSCLGAGHEDGVVAHAWCGAAVWVWATTHAVLTQLPMVLVGLWGAIVLPPANGSAASGCTNIFGLVAWLCVCAMGVTSLARLRRRYFDTFQTVHVVLLGVVLVCACVHTLKAFWYVLLGATLYAADVVQRRLLRRRAVTATATVYPLAAGGGGGVGGQQKLARRGGGGGGGAAGSEYVVLRVHTGGPPGCCAGQHVWLQVPRLSRWEWHPYSITAYDASSFALVVKGGGDWERRLVRAVTTQAGGAPSTNLHVSYEGLYGTEQLQDNAAAADRLLLFAGGAGITPVASVLQALLLLPPPPGGDAPWAQRHAADAHHHHHQHHSGSGGHLDLIGKGPAAAAAEQPNNGHSSHHAAAAAEPNGKHGGVDGVLRGLGGLAGLAAHVDARVHLVWAVTYESDAQSVMPLLRAAAARGWAVDVHCTRHCDEVAVVPMGQHASAGSLSSSSSAAAADPHHHHKHHHARAPAAAGPGAAVPPWRLYGWACWGVAAAAALLGAGGRTFAEGLASMRDCTVSAAAAAGANGVAAVRAAFVPQAAAGEAAPGWLARTLAALTAGRLGCPAGLAPGADDKAQVLDVRVCRLFGRGAPEVCVPCDPFTPRTPQQAAWPCCSALGCVYAPRLAPVLGWLVGAALGAALGCLAWRLAWRLGAQRRAARRAAAGLLSGGELAAGCWSALRAELRGGGGAEERGALLGGGGGGDASVEEGASVTGPGMEPIVAAMHAAAAPVCHDVPVGPAAAAPAAPLQPPQPPLLEPHAPAGAGVPDAGGGVRGGGDGVVHVHAGRPHFDAYLRAAASAGASTAGGGARGGAVYGVVVCGPESLQGAVRHAYERWIEEAYPGSWFRGFSFTT